MSLILDALRQAEHERGRDRSPDLFGPALGATATLSARPTASRWPWALAAGAALIAVGALAWAFWPRPPASAPATRAAAPQLPQLPQVPQVQPVRPIEPAGAALFNPPPAPPAVAEQASAAVATPPQAPAAAAATAPATVPPERPAPAPMPPPAPVDAQTPAAAELPAEVRARLPSLHITGHTYSDNPTLRTLMIDGRMFVEGQNVQPGLRLERIGPHRAVFNHQGTRFAVDF